MLGRGYSFPDAQSLLSDLRGSLEPAALERLSHYLDAAGLPPPANALRDSLQATAQQQQQLAAARLNDVQSQLLDTIPNVIAINWAPEGGANRLAATVEDIFRRLPHTKAELQSVRHEHLRSSDAFSNVLTEQPVNVCDEPQAEPPEGRPVAVLEQHMCRQGDTGCAERSCQPVRAQSCSRHPLAPSVG